jgi:DNA-binding CsgD family transcriptional regulator
MGRMGHTERPASLRAPSSPREQLLLDLVADVARHADYVRHTRGLAVRVGCSTGVQAELSAIEARLSPQRDPPLPSLSDRLDAGRERAPCAGGRSTVAQAMSVGRLGDGRTVGEAAEALVRRPLAPGPPRALDLLLDGLAAALLDEAGPITAATGDARVFYHPLVLAAWCGQEEQTSELIVASIREATSRGRGEGVVMTLADSATAVLQNGLGRHQAAFAAAQRACQYEELLTGWVLPELVEAAARSGEQELAAISVQRLSERTRVCGTEWALGIEARSRALLSEGEVAKGLYRAAINRLGRCRAATDLARAHLVFGEWLRRERRRLAAREQLRTAHEMFASMGTDGLAERAARELLATGAHARRRTVERTSQLTAQEAQVARLAYEGHSNPEIGARLFISPRTVEHHLHKVFTKMNITSRSQLDRVLPIAAEQLSRGS